MFFEILVFLFFGITVGVITGLIPGLHPNTIYVMLLSFIPFLETYGPFCIVSFVVSVAVTNTFIDFIPSLIFGAPEEGSELSVLPGHKMLMEGKGYEALYLTVAGGLFSTIFMVLSLPSLLWITPLIYSFLKSYVHIILIGIVFWMVVSERGINKFWGLAIFFLSGFYGAIVLNSHLSSSMIFPALSGMFGLSTLIMSVSGNPRVPKQSRKTDVKIGKKGPLVGWLSGMLVGFLPGVGSSQAGVIAAQVMKAKMKDFIIALGGINTSNIIFTLVVLYVVGKTRSGLAAFISQIIEIDINMIILAVPVVLVSAAVAGLFAMKIGWFLLCRISSINYTLVIKLMIGLISILVILFSGFYGVLVCIVGIFIGIFCIKMNIRRSYMMGFFILTVILYFTGFDNALYNFLYI